MEQFFAQTAWLIPSYPLMGMVLSLLWLPSITPLTGPRPAGYFNLGMTGLACLHGAIAFHATWQQAPQYIAFSWLQIADLDLTIPIEVSSITLGAILVVTSINFLAQVYAVGYLEMDWGWARFYALLALFEAGMCALALCDSLFFSYMILEVLTLGTYLLIGFWLNQSLVVTGARDAFLTKRVGDLVLLMGVLALYPLAGTWNFQELAVWAETADIDPTTATLVGLALIAGPMGKCAQFPLHLWLDEAMEGPVPSTILRNSVVVATGAWVLIKLEPVLALSPTVLSVAIAIGSITAVGGTLISMAQVDVKRALSYLTSAYMGIVFIAVGAQLSNAAFLMILTHAVAISLLVMSSGSIVLNSITQDLTQMGGLWQRRPVSGLSYLVGVAGLIALPPLGGFWSMLALLDGVWSDRPVIAVILLLVNALAAFAVTRVFVLMFGGKPQPMTERSPENGWLVTLPMTILAGFVLHLPLVLQTLSLLPDWAVLNKDVALVLIWSTLSGCSLAALVYYGPTSKPIRLPWQALQNLLAYDFYTSRIYGFSVVGSVDRISRLIDWGDRYLVDGFVNMVGLASLFGGEALKYGNSGKTQSYVLTIALGIILITLLMTWSSLTNLSLVIGG